MPSCCSTARDLREFFPLEASGFCTVFFAALAFLLMTLRCLGRMIFLPAYLQSECVARETRTWRRRGGSRGGGVLAKLGRGGDGKGQCEGEGDGEESQP